MAYIKNCYSSVLSAHVAIAAERQKINLCNVACVTIRFRPLVVKDLIHKVLIEALKDKQFSTEEAKSLTKQLCDVIKERLKGEHVLL